MEFHRWIGNFMRTRTALVLFLASVAMGAMVVFAFSVAADTIVLKTAQKEKKTEVEWREFGSGLYEAGEEEKLVLVDVYTSWCGWCKRMDKTTYRDEEVLSYLEENFISVKMDAESKELASYRGEAYEYRQIAAGFRITGYPTTLFLEPDGQHITTVPGFMKPNEFLIVLRFIGDGHYKDKSWEEYQDELELANR